MKRLITLFALTACIANLLAQVPQKMSYQCVVRNASGALVTNHPVGMRISILQGSATGTLVFSETFSPPPSSNANGLVTVEIGTGLVSFGNFVAIDWSAGTYFLKTETDPDGGTNYTIEGTSQLLSVPFAMYAEKSGDGFSGSYDDLTNKPELFNGTWSGITAKPTSLSGYGITDAISTAHVANGITSGLINNWNTAYTWGNHTGLYKASSYTPGWAEITGKPVFSAVASSGLFSDLLSRPTTLAGYGITNAMSTSHPANTITSTNISNWSVAYSWGNHNGLYRPVSWIPSWDEITDRPTTVAGYGITDAVAISGDQTIAGNKTFTGTINASSNNITNLANPKNNLDAATKEYVDNVFKALGLVEDSFAGVVTDIDGNVYKTIKIGDQIWMAENLRTSHYNDGTEIPNVEDDNEWANLTTYFDDEGTCIGTGAYCWYDNDSATYNSDYGKLYNWYAVETGKLCPTGWHVPERGPFLHAAVDCPCFDSGGLCDGDLMETGTTHWNIINPCITNSTGFTALPGGYRTVIGFNFNKIEFTGIGSMGWYWIPGDSGGTYGCVGAFYPIPRDVSWPHSPMSMLQEKEMGLSVRCVKD